MVMMRYPVLVMLACMTLAACGDDEVASVPEGNIEPDWPTIAAWPESAAEAADAAPDPERQINAIVFDDSRSMGSDIIPAKEAVVEALDAMAPADRVAVLTLNNGLILPFMDVAEAKIALPPALAGIASEGGTPLTGAVHEARELLSDEAAQARAFGTYRIIVTTDGEADDGDSLSREVEDIARKTPIQIATIGIGIGDDHVLSRPALTTFVTVDSTNQLGAALKKAVAESRQYQAITDFAEEG